MGKTWNEDEKQLVRECKSEDDLALKYLEKFGTADKSRVHSLFSHRNRLLREGQEQKAVTRYKTVFEEDQVLAHISNKLSELIEVQKEMLNLFKTIEAKNVQK